MGDGDGSYDFEDVPRFVAPLHAGEADLVMGTRLKGNILPGAMSWSHRWIGNPILSGMLRLFYRTRVSDSHCGMRSFTREALQRMGLRTTGMELASEIVVAALRSRLRLDEIPITYHPRGGVSKLNGLRDAWRHVRFMLLFSPSHLFLVPGIALCAVGALLVALLANGPRQMFGRVWDYHALLFGCLAVILGYNLMLFDVFAKSFSMAAGLGDALGDRLRFVETGDDDGDGRHRRGGGRPFRAECGERQRRAHGVDFSTMRAIVSGLLAQRSASVTLNSTAGSPVAGNEMASVCIAPGWMAASSCLTAPGWPGRTTRTRSVWLPCHSVRSFAHVPGTTGRLRNRPVRS